MQCFKLSLLISIFLSVTQVDAHSFSRGKYGEFPKWPANQNYLTLYYRPDNTSDIADSIVEQIFNQSLEQWNDNQYFDISSNLYISPISAPQAGRSEIYFDKSSPYFAGGGVVGVTQLVYRSGTGEILEADILLNDNYPFSTNPNDRFYLGNVVTHELGHVFGIGHSEVHNSTMFYMLHEQQHTIASDDHAAMNTLYPGSGGRGKITGKIIGGPNRVGIFAAHIQAISRTKGKVMAAAFSEDDGTFTIAGLPLEDDYYLYIGPPKYKQALTSYYSSARVNFCEGGKNYRGSFFESCYSDQKGFPHSIRLGYSHPNQSIGEATIRCDLSVPLPVLAKQQVDLSLNEASTHTSFAGTFSMSQFGQADKSKWQWLSIDLRGHQLIGDHSLELKMLSQSLYSTGKYRLHIYPGHDNDLTSADYIVDPSATSATGDANLELEKEIALDADYYRIAIEPRTYSIDSSQYFADYSNFKDDYYLYLFVASVKKKVAAASAYYDGSSFSGEDNSYCPAAKNSYTVISNSVDYTPEKLTSEEKETPISCATIQDVNQGPGNGPGGMLVGFCFMTGLAVVLRRAGWKAILHNYRL